MKVVKKIAIVFLMATILCACAPKQKEPSPTEVLDAYLKQIITSQVGDSLGQAKTETEGKLYQKIADLMGKVTYTLDNEQVKDDKATVDGHFKVYDMAASYNEMINRLVAEVSNDAENKSEEEINERVYTFWLEELEKISGYTIEEAREIILQKVEHEARSDAAVLYKDIENKA
ncbi:MAG: DUF3552 domain-containing protein, partial [Erysipelotrichaceae bacterium]|nr:DUF3552 domain-containing protein [Erysipelotrichaceae bacterium]